LIEFDYVSGGGLPDIPVLYLAVKVGEERIGGPALIDTGFDGGLYPNEVLYDFLSGLETAGEEVLLDISGSIPCRGVEVEAEVFHPELDVREPLGKVRAYLPEKKGFVAENVIIGREILNGFELNLNGRKVRINL